MVSIKKIGILACYNNKNYGSMLQSYATQVVLEDMGYDCEYINYRKKITVLTALKWMPRLFNAILMREKLRLLQKKVNLKKHPGIREKSAIRDKAFERFPAKYYHNISEVYLGYDLLKDCVRRYDAFLVGSDQLWIPSGLPTNFYNMKFVPDDKLKIAYSTSFGVSEIPWYQVRRTKEFLNRIDYIAVREKSGQKLIKELTGRDVEVVQDPTLLLTQKKWAESIKDEKLIDKPYIFCYFLGSNSDHRRQVEILKEKTGLKIYTMPHIDEFVKNDEEFGDVHLYDIDPGDFVNLIRHAEYVCTDSFHSTIFSMLHHKKFIVLDRYSDKLMKSRNSRIDNLCSRAGLSSRRFNCDIYNEMIQDIDYDAVDKKLQELRDDSMAYLNMALSHCRETKND